jgi:predicted phosphodiesterase
MFKTSHIFSPHTVSITPPELMATMIEQKIEKLRLNIGFQVEEAYNNTLIKGYKKLIEKDALRKLEIQTIVTELTDLLPCLEINTTPTVSYDEKADEISIHIFDLHYGAENPKNIKGLTPFSPQLVKDAFSKIAAKVNSLKAQKVHLFFGGDLIETFTGMNHPDAWKGIAAGHYGSHLIFETYQTIVNFALQINNLVAIVGVSGNHDRASANNKEEDEGFIAEIIFKFIEISLPNIEVKFDRYIMIHKVDGICHIMNHGHFKLANVTPANLILEYGDVSCFNLLTSGHWHERQVKEDHRLFRQIVCPSILPGNMYSRKSGYSTSPGYLIVKRDRETNKPEILDRPL